MHTTAHSENRVSKMLLRACFQNFRLQCFNALVAQAIVHSSVKLAVTGEKERVELCS
jgi:hypothetical protein